jgi:hypothetical protein
MKSNISKNSVNSILLILLLSFSNNRRVTNHSRSAHTPMGHYTLHLHNRHTQPNRLSVNQPLLCSGSTGYPPPQWAARVDRWLFYLDIIAPDGSKQKVGPLTSDPVGRQLHTFSHLKPRQLHIHRALWTQELTGSTGTGIYNNMGFGGQIQ